MNKVIDEDFESKTEAKRIEFEAAEKSIEKYISIVPLNISDPIGHDANEMKKDYERYNMAKDEYFSLMREVSKKRRERNE